jgi:LmbE family N-acetylglucosaminyl deacetylase
MPTALAFSPHLDDAAFSCGGTLAALAAAGWRVVVATVFTRSMPNPTGFALACQLDKGLGEAVDYMALRRSEDEASMRALGASPIWLPFPEAPHRGYGSAPELFAPPRPDDRTGETIAPALRALTDAETPDLILAPQAIGGHVDHVAVARAVAHLPDCPPVLWWSDFPYVLKVPAERAAGVPFGAQAVEVAPDQAARARKRQACHAYVSQIGFQFGGPQHLDEQLARSPVERFLAQSVDAAIFATLGQAETVT